MLAIGTICLIMSGAYISPRVEDIIDLNETIRSGDTRDIIEYLNDPSRAIAQLRGDLYRPIFPMSDGEILAYTMSVGPKEPYNLFYVTSMYVKCD